jgi:hypothetical protein
VTVRANGKRTFRDAAAAQDYRNVGIFTKPFLGRWSSRPHRLPTESCCHTGYLWSDLT